MHRDQGSLGPLYCLGVEPALAVDERRLLVLVQGKPGWGDMWGSGETYYTGTRWWGNSQDMFGKRDILTYIHLTKTYAVMQYAPSVYRFTWSPAAE